MKKNDSAMKSAKIQLNYRARVHAGSSIGEVLRRAMLLLFLLLGSVAGMAQTYYVFSANASNNARNFDYLKDNGGYTDALRNASDYDCIWVLNTNGTLQNVSTGRYLTSSASLTTSAASAGRFYIATSGSYPGTLMSSDNNVPLRYYSYYGWNFSQGYYTYPTQITSITPRAASVVSVSVTGAAGEDDVVTLDETTASYTASTATYRPNYITYSFTCSTGRNATTSYTYNATPFTGSGATTNYGTGLPPEIAGITPSNLTVGGTAFTWTWSHGDPHSTLAVSPAGLVTVSNRYSTDERFSLTATVALASDAAVNAAGTKSGILIYGTAIAAPVIAQEGNAITLTSPSAGTTLYYTTDGSDPTTSATASAYTSAFNLTTSPATVKAVAMRTSASGGYYSDVTTKVCYMAIDAPVITFGSTVISGAAATTTTTLTLPASAPAGTAIYYTTDGSDPVYTVAADGTVTVTTGTLYSAPFSVSNMTEVRALCVRNGWNPSLSAHRLFTASSGLVSNGDGTSTVVLIDLEDHAWSYYSGDPDPCDAATLTAPAPLRTRPCDVKIVYKAGGVGTSMAALGIDAPTVTEFNYYETLEIKNGSYPYVTIPNPFSKRPKVGDQYYGFDHWTVKSLTGGSLSDGTTTISDGATTGSLSAEAELTFTPTATPSDGITITLELEADWEYAYVVECDADYIYSNLNSNTLQGGSYERNFIVVTSGTTRYINYGNATQKPVTITMVYPDGTAASSYNSTGSYLSGDFTGYADTKFEYIHLNATSGTFYANNNDLIFGRGISNTTAGNVCVNYVCGMSGSTSTNLDYTIRIESGVYTDLSFLGGTESRNGTNVYAVNFSGASNNIRVTLGSDYDRATDNNSLLQSKHYMYMSYGYFYNNPYSANRFTAVAKSGKFQTNCTDAGYQAGSYNNDADECFYVSTGRSQQYPGVRRFIILGGEFSGVAGGIDENNSGTDTSFYFRMKGGTLRGSLYGAGAFAAASGNRKYVITGGQIKGWVAGACNGTSTTQSGGTMNGNTYLYIGGTAVVGDTSLSTQNTINASQGGNVFGAGSGNSTYPNTGQVNNSIVVIADEAQVVEDVYGGGNYGYAQYDGQVHILGGTVGGSVFGGSNQKGGTTTEVYMRGGYVRGSLYGGSNTKGDISGDVLVTVEGGTVGSSAAQPGSVFGGGYGQQTGVGGNMAVTIGKAQSASCSTPLTAPTIYGDVYGGSQKGLVNINYTTSPYYVADYNTHVILHQGTVQGNLYGGGYGEGDVAADVAGDVTVHILGGYVGGSVFGCNNVAGQPRGTVSVTVSSGSMDNLYGGGNNAAYGGGTYQEAPHVLMTGGMVRTSVFGGGLGSTATLSEDTDVRVRGNATVLHNVYGGGSAARVTGSTHVEIGGSGS